MTVLSLSTKKKAPPELNTEADSSLSLCPSSLSRAARYGSAAAGEERTRRNATLDCHGSRGYPLGLPFREELAGTAPWHLTLGALEGASRAGDRGFIVRDYTAVLGGAPAPRPAISLFCDRLELSVPRAVGGDLRAGDYVEFSLEALLLPRPGAALAAAFAATGSSSLALAAAGPGGTSSDLAAAQASGSLFAWAVLGEVQGHYPLRVCKTDGAAREGGGGGSLGCKEQVFFSSLKHHVQQCACLRAPCPCTSRGWFLFLW